MARGFWLLLVLTLAAVACSGAPGVRTVLPNAVPLANEAPPPFGSSERVRLRKNAWIPIPLPSGFSGSFYLTPASSIKPGTVAYVVTSSTDLAPQALPDGTRPLFYANVSVGSTAQFASGTLWRFTLPKSYLKNATYYVGLYDPGNPAAGWQLAYSAKGSASGMTVTVRTKAALVLAPTIAYTFALYSARVPVAAPRVTSYELVGTMKQHYTFAYPSAPYASSSPQPPIEIVESVQQFYGAVATQPPAPIPNPPASLNAVDVHLTEIDRQSRQTTVASGDSYLYRESGRTYATGSIAYIFAPQALVADTTTTVYHSPQLVAVVPSSVPYSWSNSRPRQTIDQVFSGGVTYHRSVNDDGSYQETGTVPQPQGPPEFTTLTELSNGSGSYANSQQFQNGFCEYSFNTPDPRGRIVIDEYANYASSQSCGDLYARIVTPTWFPSPPPSAAPPSSSLVLLADSNTAYPAAPAPPSCKTAAKTSATLVVRTRWQLDTVVGYSEFTQLETYRNAKGATVCLILSDTLQNYYDWLGNNPNSTYGPLFTTSGQPLSTVVTRERLWSPARTPAAGEAFAVAEAAQLHFLARIERLKAALLTGRRRK